MPILLDIASNFVFVYINSVLDFVSIWQLLLLQMLRKILENRSMDIYAKLRMQYQEGLAYVISNTKYTAQIELLEEILSDKLHF